MTLEHLRSVRDASPFVPFTIYQADGRLHRVPHRDFLSLPPSGRMIIVHHPDESFSLIDLLLVTELRVDPVPVATSEPVR